MKDCHSNIRSEFKEKLTILDILFLSLAKCTLRILQDQNNNNNVCIGVPYFCLEFSRHKGVHMHTYMYTCTIQFRVSSALYECAGGQGHHISAS